jgi:hypothetical protein
MDFIGNLHEIKIILLNHLKGHCHKKFLWDYFYDDTRMFYILRNEYGFLELNYKLYNVHILYIQYSVYPMPNIDSAFIYVPGFVATTSKNVLLLLCLVTFVKHCARE